MNCFYKTPENLTLLCSHLRSPSGPPSRESILISKRVLYLKGEKLLTYLTDRPKKWPRKFPKIEDRLSAGEVARELVKQGFLLRAVKKEKGILAVSPEKDFEESGLYVWLYEGDQTYSNLLTGVLIVGFLACVCFPIWPQMLKVWVWYLSVTLLLLIFGICVLRGVVFIVFWIIGRDFWILPNLFDESLGVAESFVPLYSFEKSSGSPMFRAVVLCLIAASIHWAISQPTEFDGMISAQKDFLDDLYSGNLLSDMSQQGKEDIDKPKMKSLDDLLQELDEVDDEEKAGESVIDHLMKEDEREEGEEVPEL
ncbi:hypothetical protein TL16_g12882 [Triparma laevis f. inornata]|uniref:Translocation protein SEC62 n=1 Tax=Triparma laevis f. inornata TaxID=1714386 RepID=A0A9W7BPF5_9STRA|nr:hypothetical protein TL16_g12882 [Triparma laevis f. inornata]